VSNLNIPSAENVPAPTYYRHTGQAPFISTTFATLASWIVVTILAIAYAYIDLHVKVADVISAAFMCAFAAAMAFAVFGIIRSACVRNVPVTFIISGSAAVLALYVSWLAWMYFVIAEAGVTPGAFEFVHKLFPRPDVVWDFAREINTRGTFTLHDSPVTGTFLWILWFAEALTMLAVVGVLPPQLLRKQSFCEPCGRWCRKPKGIIRLAHGDEDLLKSQMEARNFAYLASIQRAHYDTPMHFHVEIVQCGTCDETNLLTVNRITVGKDSKGNRQETVKKIVDRLHIGADEAEDIKALSTVGEEPAKPTPAPPTNV
jgi:hypothetical protein